MGGCEQGFGWTPPFLLVCCLLLCPFHHPNPITQDKGMPKRRPSPPCRVPLPAPSPRCISPAALSQLTGKKRRARTHGQPPGWDHRALLPPPAMSLGLGTAGTRSTSPPQHSDSRPLCLSPCIPVRGSAGQQHPSVHPNSSAGGERGPRRRFPWSFPIRATRPVPPVTSAAAAGRSRRWRWPRRGAGGPGAAAPRAPRPSRGGCC